MGFRLTPPSGSGLSLSLSVDLPLPKDWDLSAPRIIDTATNLSGESIFSSFAKSVTLSSPVYEQDLSEETFAKLDALDHHATQTEWSLNVDSRSFLVLIDVTKATRMTKYNKPYRAVTMSIKIIRETTL